MLGKLQVVTTSNLLSNTHPVYVCLRNHEDQTLTSPALLVWVETLGEVVDLPDIPPGGQHCVSLSPSVVGYGFLFGLGDIGGTFKSTQPLQVFVSRTLVPAYETPGRRLALVVADVAFTNFMGVFGYYVPRLRDVDYMVAELDDGRIAVITKDEITRGDEPTWKPKGTAFSLTIEYQFSNLEALASFLESAGGYVARLNFRTSADFYNLPADKRIDLMLPYVNWLGKWSTFTTSITADKSTATLRARKAVRSMGIAPLAAIAYGATILFAGAGVALALYSLKNFFRRDGDARTVIPAVIATSNNEINAMKEIAKVIIDALDPAVLAKPKDAIKQEIDTIAGRAISDNRAIQTALTATPPRQPTLSERVGDLALKAGAGVVTWELLKRLVAGRG